MKFQDLDFSERLNKMGDLAEGKFEEVAPWPYARYGLNRPPFRLDKVPTQICYTPDYLTENYLVEVQGFGRSQEVHMKLDKLQSLAWWHEQMEVLLFLYDSFLERHTFFRFHTVRDLCLQSQIKVFPEGKEYYAIPADVAWVYGQEGISL